MLYRYRLAPLAAFALLAAPRLAHAQATPPGGVTIGAATAPDPSAVLDLRSTSKGLLLPRLSLAQRQALTASTTAPPVPGLVIYQTDNTPGLYAYDGTAWVRLGADNLGNHLATQNLDLGANQLVGNGGSTGLTLSSGGNVGLGTSAAQPATQKLDVRGNVRLGNDMSGGTGAGQAIEWVGPGVNTDPVGLYRYNPAADQSELRVVVGDVPDANDKFAVGRMGGTSAEGGIPGGTFTPTFSVSSAGLVTAPSLAGTTTRMVTASTDGTLATQALPTDAQALSLSGQTLSLTNGGSVTLPTGTGDNLGNHTATQNLDLGTNQLVGNGGSAGLTVSSAGNVGIGLGTASPTQALDVNGGILARGNDIISKQGAYLQWNRTGGDGETWLLNQMGGGNANAGIRFGSVTTSDATTEWGRFVNNGNFGLGTTAPAASLDVNGGLVLEEVTSPPLTGYYPSFVIPANVSTVRLVSGTSAPYGIISLTSTAPVVGQRLTVYNGTPISEARLGGQTIGAGQTGSFVYSNGGWRGGALGDNLGNHMASQSLNLQGNALVGTGADLGNTVGVGIRADGGLNLGQRTNGNSLYLGFQAGRVNTGKYNQFSGYQSGYSNAYGEGNLFIGYQSGYSNEAGSYNLFSGYQSGYNTAGSYNSTGSYNVFSGSYSGYSNTTGSGNTALGSGSGPANGSGNLTNTTALGANATVSTSNSLVLGGTGNFAVSVGIGTTAPDASAVLDIVSSNKGVLLPRVATVTAIASPAPGLLVYQTASPFPPVRPAGFYYNAGTAAAPSWQQISTTTNGDNLGNHTATQSLNLQGNALVGNGFDLGSTIGVGIRPDGGLNLGQNTNGNSLYLGFQAGRLNNVGFSNSNQFIGYQSGYSNTNGSSNQFSGYQSGYSNQGGSYNLFSGYQSGYNTTGSYYLSTGSYNLFSGSRSGYYNTTGSSNTALGSGSGPANGSGNLTNTTALGANATVATSNTIQLGDANITSLRCQVGLTVTSDARFKYDVQANVPGLAFIERLRPVTYRFDQARLTAFAQTGTLPAPSAPDAGAEVRTGFLAQEVEATAQALGFRFDGVHAPANARDHYGLSYAQFVVPLVRAVQELSAANAALKARAAAAETQAARATATLDAFEARLRALEAGGAQARQ